MPITTTPTTATAAAAPQSRVRRVITWLRVPLVILACLVLFNFINDVRAFWWGVPFVLFGEWLQIWTSAHLYKNNQFTTSGPYAYARNMMYTGRYFLVLGFFVMTQSWIACLIYTVLYAIYAHVRVLREEKRLAKIFAPEYQHYCGEVNRWLPRLKPYSRATDRRFSWKQACFNNEHLNIIATLFVLALVYLRIILLPSNFLSF